MLDAPPSGDAPDTNPDTQHPQIGPWLFGAAWGVLTLLVLMFAIGIIEQFSPTPYSRRDSRGATDAAAYLITLGFLFLGAVVVRRGLRVQKNSRNDRRCFHCHALAATLSPCSECGACIDTPQQSDWPTHAIEDHPADDLRDFLRGRDALCPECNYNLRNCIGDRCPECGTSLSLELVKERLATLPGEFLCPGTSRSAPRDVTPGWARVAALITCVVMLLPTGWLVSFLTEFLDFGPYSLVVFGLELMATVVAVGVLAHLPAWANRWPDLAAFVAWLARPLMLVGVFAALAIAAAAIRLLLK